MDDRDRQAEVGDARSMLHAGTTGAEARDMARGSEEADGPAAGTPYGSRDEVVAEAMAEQREIEAAHGSTPEADPSQRSGFNRILSLWTLAGALLGAGAGAFAGWLAVEYRHASVNLIIALAAVGVVVGAVLVGASRVGAEDGRVQSVVDTKLPKAGVPGDQDLEREEPEEAPKEPVGTRPGG